MSIEESLKKLASKTLRAAKACTSEDEADLELQKGISALKRHGTITFEDGELKRNLIQRLAATLAVLEIDNFVAELNELASSLEGLGVSVKAANDYADNMPLVKIAKAGESFVAVKTAVTKMISSLDGLSNDSSDEDFAAAQDAISSVQVNLRALVKPEG